MDPFDQKLKSGVDFGHLLPDWQDKSLSKPDLSLGKTAVIYPFKEWQWACDTVRMNTIFVTSDFLQVFFCRIQIIELLSDSKTPVFKIFKWHSRVTNITAMNYETHKCSSFFDFQKFTLFQFINIFLNLTAHSGNIKVFGHICVQNNSIYSALELSMLRSSQILQQIYVIKNSEQLI